MLLLSQVIFMNFLTVQWSTQSRLDHTHVFNDCWPLRSSTPKRKILSTALKIVPQKKITKQSTHKHKTHSRLSLTVTHTNRHISTHTHESHKYTHIHNKLSQVQAVTLTLTKTRGTWRKTRHLDRLLTTDATSRQHKTHSRLSLTVTHTNHHIATHTHESHKYTHIHNKLSQVQVVTLTLTKHGVPDERRNILTGCWQRTQHPDSTRPTQGFHSLLHTRTHIHNHNFKLLRSHSRNTGYLTKDASSWQAADNGRNIQTAQDPLKAFTHYCTHAHTYTITISSCYAHTHKTRGTWRKTHHLDRLLTTDETSRQHKTHSRLSLTAAHTHTHTQSQFQIVTLTLTKHGVPDERRIILTGCWQRTKHPDSTRPTQGFHSLLHTRTHIHNHNFKLLRSHSQNTGYLT